MSSTQYGDKWTNPGNIVTNGPFTLTESVPGPGGHVVLVPNPNWALTPKPTLQRITVNYVDDLEAAFQAFQAAELDMTNIPVSEIPRSRPTPP